MYFPVEALKRWFLEHSRRLPWRVSPTPYAVWVSEVMLQQTQASVVVEYFQRWMSLFPTIEALAEAPIEKVIKEWEGLGYYQRVRNLHEAARFLMKYHGGNLPEDPEALRLIKGLGPYTIGAILSFAFHKKAAAVDGNVLRVLSRFFGIEEEIDSLKTRKKLQELTLALLPDETPWIISEGLIELGALICTKSPKCSECPLKKECVAFCQGMEKRLPLRRVRPKITHIQRNVAIIFHGTHYLLQQGEKGKVMADLYEFPYVDRNESDESPRLRFEEMLGLKLIERKCLNETRHSFTRFRATLYPYLFESQILDSRYTWHEKESLQTLPFSSGHRRIKDLL